MSLKRGKSESGLPLRGKEPVAPTISELYNDDTSNVEFQSVAAEVTASGGKGRVAGSWGVRGLIDMKSVSQHHAVDTRIMHTKLRACQP